MAFILMCNRIAVAALVIAAAWALQGPAGATSVIALAPGVLVDPNAAIHGLDAGLADFNTPAAVTAPGQSSPPQGSFAVGGASFSGGAILGAPGKVLPGFMRRQPATPPNTLPSDRSFRHRMAVPRSG